MKNIMDMTIAEIKACEDIDRWVKYDLIHEAEKLNARFAVEDFLASRGNEPFCVADVVKANPSLHSAQVTAYLTNLRFYTKRLYTRVVEKGIIVTHGGASPYVVLEYATSNIEGFDQSVDTVENRALRKGIIPKGADSYDVYDTIYRLQLNHEEIPQPLIDYYNGAREFYKCRGYEDLLA